MLLLLLLMLLVVMICVSMILQASAATGSTHQVLDEGRGAVAGQGQG